MDLCCLKFICCLHCICIVELCNYIDVYRCINFIPYCKKLHALHALHNIYTVNPKNNGHCQTCAVCRIRVLGQLILDREMGVSKGADLMKGACFKVGNCGCFLGRGGVFKNQPIEIAQCKNDFQRKQTSIMAGQLTRP